MVVFKKNLVVIFSRNTTCEAKVCQAVGSAIFSFFLNLFIVSKNLNLFIYVLLSSIYTCEAKV
jgi:hypothetical protein